MAAIVLERFIVYKAILVTCGALTSTTCARTFSAVRLCFVALDTPYSVDRLDSAALRTNKDFQRTDLQVKQPVLDFSVPRRPFFSSVSCLAHIFIPKRKCNGGRVTLEY